MEKSENAESYKVCFIGRYAVGKTSLINRYITDLFSNEYNQTFVKCYTEVLVPFHDRVVSMKIWDTAGQEEFRSLVPLFLQDCDCVILVIDITVAESFDYIENWINSEWQSMSPTPMPILCLNKCDLSPTFDIEKAAKMAFNFNIPIVQTSALSGANVKKLFQKVVESLVASEHRHSYVTQSLNEDSNKSCC